jgi:glycosyltransferase involved in cell wall biosynthesis
MSEQTRPPMGITYQATDKAFAASLEQKPLRVLYSFPHKFGAGRICHIAWQQVNGAAKAGCKVLVFPGAIHKPVVASSVTFRPTLARWKFRIPYRLLGITRACILHDHIVARRLEQLADKPDIVHVWPLAALETLKTAARLGIPTVLERPNAHTRFAFEVVQQECDRIGVTLPPGYEHAYQADVLAREEEEYRLADQLLCPSEFVLKTFLDRGFSSNVLARHQYGYDPERFYPDSGQPGDKRGLTVLFAGLCAVRKGLHFALEAWLKSPAHKEGIFLIAGEFLPAYKEKLSAMLAHPSVKVLGPCNDMPRLMRSSDVMLLPSIEEGFGLVCAEAVGSGCIPLVSEACTEMCRHLENALVHRVGDVEQLEQHITMLYEDRELLDRMRATCVATATRLTWDAAGRKLDDVYREAVTRRKGSAALVSAAR